MSRGIPLRVNLQVFSFYLCACMGFAASATAQSSQPDLLVRREADVNWIGDNVYNLTGVGQSRFSEIEPGETACYWVQVSNDGAVTNSVRVTATPATPGWTAAFFKMDGTNQTDLTTDMLGGGHVLTLRPKAAVDLLVEVEALATAPHGSTNVVSLSATTESPSSLGDVVALSDTTLVLP